MLSNIKFKEYFHKDTNSWRYIVNYTKYSKDFQVNTSYKERKSQEEMINIIKDSINVR